MSTRTIPFAEGRHLGTLYQRSPSDVWGGGLDWWSGPSQEVDGPVLVPGDVQVRLWASQKPPGSTQRATSRFEGLRELSGADLDSLAILDPEPGWALAIDHLVGLSELVVSHVDGIPDDELRCLDPLQTLIGLDVEYSGVESAQLVRLLDRHLQIQFLYTGGNRLGSAVGSIAQLSQLRRLDLSKTDIGDAQLDKLRALDQLDSLSLEGCAITDAAAPALGRMRTLEELRLDDTRIGDATIAGLDCPSLRMLFVGNTMVTGETLNPDALPELEVLLIGNAQLSDKGMARIARLPNLKTLQTHASPVTDKGWAMLNGHPTLEAISMIGSRVSPGTLLGLIESLPNLFSIWIGPFDRYETPERIAAYAYRLRNAHPGHIALKPEDLKPKSGVVGHLDGKWADLGPIVAADPTCVRTFAYEPGGRLWVGGLRALSHDERRTFPAGPHPLMALPTRKGPVLVPSAAGFLAFDRDGRLWIGDRDLRSYSQLDGAGLRKERRSRGGFYTGISFDSEGQPWVSRDSAEVWRLTSDGWQRLQVPDLPWDASLHDIACHPDGSVWLTSRWGLHRWRDGEWDYWRGPTDGLPDDYHPGDWGPAVSTRMRSLAIGKDGALWACGGTGVVRYINGEFTKWDQRDGMWPWRELHYQEETGRLYAVGDAHIGCYEGDVWKVAQIPEKYASSSRPTRTSTLRNGAIIVMTDVGRLLRFKPRVSTRRARRRATGRRFRGHLG